MQITKQILVICTFLLLAGACSSHSNETPKTENDELNKLLQQGTITTINLGSVPVDTVLAGEKNIMGKERAASLDTSGTLVRAVDLVKVGDSLYVADAGQKSIWVMDNRGRWIRKVGRRGRGPDEFGSLNGIDANSRNIFTFDASNSRVQVYDKRLSLKASFPHVAIPSNSRGIAVNDYATYLLADYTEQNNLIEMKDTEKPFEKIGSFWSPIVPYGRQPLAYNNYVIAANNTNKVALAFTGLPYVFILDENQKVDFILYLRSSLWEKIKKENPSVRSVENATPENSSVSAYLLHLHLADNGSLYLRTQDAFYTLKEEDGTYHLEEARKFMTNEKLLRGGSGPIRVPAGAMEVKNNTVYFASGFTSYIYRFPLK